MFLSSCLYVFIILYLEYFVVLEVEHFTAGVAMSFATQRFASEYQFRMLLENKHKMQWVCDFKCILSKRKPFYPGVFLTIGSSSFIARQLVK